MTTVTDLRKQIIAAIEVGEPTEKLEADLQAALAEERRASERDRLSAIASRRKAYKAQAEGVMGKVKRQGTAIDSFIKGRNGLVKSLSSLIEKAKALEPTQAACFTEYHDSRFREETRHIPRNYLPEGLTCPVLGHAKYAGQEIVQWTAHYLRLALECLSQVEVAKVQSTPGPAAGDDLEDKE